MDTGAAGGAKIALFQPPAEPATEDPDEWFYVDVTHSKVGPMKCSVIVNLITCGTLDLSVEVWVPQMEQWKSFSMLPELMVA